MKSVHSVKGWDYNPLDAQKYSLSQIACMHVWLRGSVHATAALLLVKELKNHSQHLQEWPLLSKTQQVQEKNKILE